jgi:hypothetical protein
MEAAWVLIAAGVFLVALASRPVSRARSNAAAVLRQPEPPIAPSTPSTPDAPLVAPTSQVEAPTPSSAQQSLTPEWLDSLIGSDGSGSPEDPLEDIEGIAGVLRLWLAEDAR